MPTLDELVAGGLEALANDVDTDPEQCLEQVRSSGRRAWRRRTAVRCAGAAGAAVAIVVLAGALWRHPVAIETITPGPPTPPSSVVPSGLGSTQGTSSEDPADEGYVDPDKRSRYRAWLDEYDSAEIARLRQIQPDIADPALVTTLEFRDACRVAASTWDQVQAAAPSDAERTAHDLMDPEIARLAERKTSAKSMEDTFFADLRDHMARGDVAFVNATIEKNCGEALRIRREPQQRPA